MPGVTSLSVLFLLLVLCPLDVAGLPEDIQVMFIRVNKSNINLLDPATQRVTLLFTTTEPVTAMDYDPVNRKVYWCGSDKQCYIQDDNGSNPTALFHTEAPVKDIQVVENSTLYYLDTAGNIWMRRNGQQPEVVASEGVAITVFKSPGNLFYYDAKSWIHVLGGNSVEVNESVTFMALFPTVIFMEFREENLREENSMYLSVRPNEVAIKTSCPSRSTDEEMFLVVDKASGPEIITMSEEEPRIIVKDFQQIGYISLSRDAIVFTALREGDDCYQLYMLYKNGTNLRTFGSAAHSTFIKPVLFEANGLVGSAATEQGCVEGCLQMNGGTSIKVTLTPGLEDFSLLVMDPPNGCSRDLGQFRQDITIPGSCVVDQRVEVAVQLTEIKDILGGRFFRHFLFSCSELGPDGMAMELNADANPGKTQATASNTSYADGVFSLMVVTSASLNSGAELTSATNVIWSQEGVFLVLRHRLATGSQHRTLIPAECIVNSTSHPEKKTLWLAKPDKECKQEMGLMDAWTIQSKRTETDDVTYSPLFPFDFQVGEEVTITCNAHECPYVADPGQLQGKCLEAFEKYKSCGGTFPGSSPKRRREVTSLSGNGPVPWDQGKSRVVSASFTLV